MKTPLRLFACNTALLGLLLMSSCQTPPPPAPQILTATVRVPVITALPETKEAQEKGGVEIALVPVSYQAEKSEKTTTRQANPSFGGMVAISIVTGGNSGGQVYIQQVKEQQLSVRPERLKFTVRVNNKLSRVFRGQGSVVQFNVAGKLQPFGKTDYAEFISGIVPPRNEAEFMIAGPSLDSLPEKGTIGIFLYDVVTSTDIAGNVTEKQNYEWYFSYELKSETQNIERKVTEGWIDAGAFQQLMIQEQQEPLQKALQRALKANSP